MKIEERIVSPEDLSNDVVEIVKVTMDDKGGVMYIGSLSADDFVEWQETKDGGNQEAKKNASAQLMMRSLVKGPTDPTRIGTPSHVVAFRKAKVSRTERLLKAILKLNYINQKDEADAKN
jgi:hypothetical protein